MATQTDQEYLADVKTEYRYGFHDTQLPFFKAERGLNHAVIDQISDHKNEPDWMRQFRHEALDIFFLMLQVFDINLWIVDGAIKQGVNKALDIKDWRFQLVRYVANKLPPVNGKFFEIIQFTASFFRPLIYFFFDVVQDIRCHPDFLRFKVRRKFVPMDNLVNQLYFSKNIVPDKVVSS